MTGLVIIDVMDVTDRKLQIATIVLETRRKIILVYVYATCFGPVPTDRPT
jgi:hypothetical protein